MSKKPYVCIVQNRTHGNSFGDRIFDITLELRSFDHQVLGTKSINETAFEGEHRYYRTKILKDIKAYAKANGAKFTGEVLS